MKTTFNIVRNTNISRVLIVAMLFQAILVVVHLPAKALGMEGSISFFSNTITICTNDGVKHLRVNANGEQVDETRHTSFKEYCDVCMSYADIQYPVFAKKRGISDVVLKQNKLAVTSTNPEGFSPLDRRGRGPPSSVVQG